MLEKEEGEDQGGVDQGLRKGEGCVISDNPSLAKEHRTKQREEKKTTGKGQNKSKKYKTKTFKRTKHNTGFRGGTG